MRNVTYSMSMSVDGYIEGPDGTFNWSVPDDEVFRLAMDEVRGVGVHLMGRKLYEAMLYWENVVGDPGLSDLEREWIDLWNPLPKVVFSRSLSEVRGNARLATGTVAEEIELLRADSTPGDIAVGGATLAAEVARLGLIDEYRIRVYPVLAGGGLPFFDHGGRFVDLELLESRRFPLGVQYLHYRVTR
jgi:dihydrofolate reductase